MNNEDEDKRLAAFGLASDGKALPDPFDSPGNGITTEPFPQERGSRKKTKRARRAKGDAKDS